MTGLDYAVFGILAISILLGFFRGVVGELIALAAWALAFFAAREFSSTVAHDFLSPIGDPTIAQALAWGLVFIATLIVMGIGKLALSTMIRMVGLGFVDRFFGMIFGAIRGALIVLFLSVLASMTAIPNQPWWKNATVAPPLQAAILFIAPWLPADVAKRIRFN